jgi:hypothetical protein
LNAHAHEDGRGWFSQDYRSARNAFLIAANEAGAVVQSFECGARDLDGGRLWMDIARIGSEHAKVAIFLVCGVHGVEGFFGSAHQTKMLRQQGSALARTAGSVAYYFVHALNPFGFACLRRTNEDNVDLNRNFVDFDRGLSPDRGYEELHDLLVAAPTGEPARDEADRLIDRYIAERGMAAFATALTSGQYTRPGGLFYGGAKPSWSRKVWFDFLDATMPRLERAVVVDFHTGLGARGEIELIHLSCDRDRAVGIWGERVRSLHESNASSAIVGSLLGATCERYPSVDLTAVAIELGTLPALDVLSAMRDDAWLIANPGCDRSTIDAVAKRNRAVFILDDPDWQRRAIAHGDWVVERLLRSLGSVPARARSTSA